MLYIKLVYYTSALNPNQMKEYIPDVLPD